MMKLRYETGIAAMVQFLVVLFLNFIGAIVSAIDSCHDAVTTYDCVSGVGIDVFYVILLAFWFGFIWMLAYAAQDRRDHRLAGILMATEFLVLVVALFNAKHYPNIVGLITSLANAALAVWVIYLAFRLTRAKGGRITAHTAKRPRRRAMGKSSDEA